MKREVYLDNSATTKPFDEVVDYIDYINKNIYGNPSSLHTKGIEAERLIKKARGIIADSIGAEPGEIIFTSGGTESNNLAVRGYLEANPRKGRHIITTEVEHPSVLELYRYLSNRGYLVDFIDVDKNGIINMESLRRLMREDTAIVSIIMVNNETGTIQPIDEIISCIKSINKNTVVHVDAVQAYGKLHITPKKLGIDLMSVSSHKIHGPKGTGALYAAKGVKLGPIIFGGGQEMLLRSGTENVTGICGFGLASEIIFKDIDASMEKVSALNLLFRNELRKSLIEHSVNSPENALPYILNVSFPGAKAEVILHHLEDKGIYVSTGSACSSRKNIHSHVLKAMGLPACDIEGAVRFSFSRFNDSDDVYYTIDILKEIMPKITIRRGGKR